MEDRDFQEKKNEIHVLLSKDDLKKAISTLFQMLGEFPKNDLRKRTIIAAAALERIEKAWRIQTVDWDTYDGGKNGVIADVYDIVDDLEELNHIPAGTRQYEEKHQELVEKVKGLIKKLGRTPATPMAVLLLALGLVSSERIGGSHYTDYRDGKTYRTVRLDGKTWLAQNLNYDVGEGCWFYDNDPKNGEKYGRLYTWEAAKKACPPGWRLPTDEEWRALAMAHGGLYDDGKDLDDPKKAFSALIEGGSSGFSALFGGYRGTDGSFLNLGVNGYYWSATGYGTGHAWYYIFYRIPGKLYRNIGNKGLGFSCRCVQATPSNGND